MLTITYELCFKLAEREKVMLNWNRSLENYLKEFGALHAKMGEGKEGKIDKDNQQLMAIINKEKPLANMLFLIITVMYIVLFIGGIIIIFFNKSSDANLALLIGGGGSVGLIGIVKALESVWRDKVEMDFLFVVAREWEPKDAIRFAQQTYYNRKKSKSE